MEEIIKILLLEGIDEDTIHRVLDVIEEEYYVFETSDEYKLKKIKGSLDSLDSYENNIEKLENVGVPDQVIQDLKTDLIKKKHKVHPKIERIKQKQIKKIKSEEKLDNNEK